jgi:hypothetical protein
MTPSPSCETAGTTRKEALGCIQHMRNIVFPRLVVLGLRQRDGYTVRCATERCPVLSSDHYMMRTQGNGTGFDRHAVSRNVGEPGSTQLPKQVPTEAVMSHCYPVLDMKREDRTLIGYTASAVLPAASHVAQVRR